MTTSPFTLALKDDRIDVCPVGTAKPSVTQHAAPNHRPFLHPITAPDGVGALTEYSPGHHPHQTGLYWGFTRINGSDDDAATLKEWFYKKDKPAEVQRQVGRDFFHNPGAGFWRRQAVDALETVGARVRWRTVYDLLDAGGASLLTETQTWAFQKEGAHLVLDLEWRGRARGEVKVGAFAYGGLFLRMPFRPENGGRALNSEGADQPAAEGQKARWVGVEMPIPGREGTDEPLGSIAVMDHPANADHPTPWRVDGQLGVGPCRAITGTWTIADGKTAVFRHRLLVGAGGLDPEAVEHSWQEFARS